MLFVIEENKQFVHLGPVKWSKYMFQSFINDELEINFQVPVNNDLNVVIEINDNYSIMPAEIVYPNMNQKYQQLSGPFWTFTDTLATGTYNAVDKSVSQIQNELKSIVASNRYFYETKGVTVTIRNQELNLTTNRGERDIFLQALQTGSDNNSWKVNGNWYTLSLADLQLIVDTIKSHVQTAFDWEKTTSDAIMQATTSAEFDAITLTYPGQPNPFKVANNDNI